MLVLQKTISCSKQHTEIEKRYHISMDWKSWQRHSYFKRLDKALIFLLILSLKVSITLLHLFGLLLLPCQILSRLSTTSTTLLLLLFRFWPGLPVLVRYPPCAIFSCLTHICITTFDRIFKDTGVH